MREETGSKETEYSYWEVAKMEERYYNLKDQLEVSEAIEREAIKIEMKQVEDYLLEDYSAVGAA